MKKKLALLLSCMVLCALVLVGCGGGGNAYAGTTWELTRAEAYGVTMEGEMLDSTVGEMSIKFIDDTKLEIRGTGSDNGRRCAGVHGRPGHGVCR